MNTTATNLIHTPRVVFILYTPVTVFKCIHDEIKKKGKRIDLFNQNWFKIIDENQEP